MNAKLDMSGPARAYGESFRKMRQLEGFSQTQLLRSEVGVILKTWAGETKVSTQAESDLRSREKAIRDLGFTGGKRNAMTSAGGATISINTGKRGPYGRVFMRKRNATGSNQWRRTHDANFQPLWQHYKNGDWIDLKEAIEDTKIAVRQQMEAGRKSTSLSRNSVVQCADALGIDLATVKGGRLSGAGLAKARAAIASNGKSYANGTGSKGGDEVKCFVQFLNRLPYNAKIGMDSNLDSILARRSKFIETLYAKGVFDSVKASARAFPNLFNTSGLQLR